MYPKSVMSTEHTHMSLRPMFGYKPVGKQLTNGTRGWPAMTDSITVSQVAREMGIRLQPDELAAIEEAAAEAYELAHGAPPPRQFVIG